MTAQVGKKRQVHPHKSKAIGLWLFVSSFTLFALTSSPSIGWLDSPEFVAQAASLGVAHSPGHPLPALLGRLATLFPVGDLVWRVNLMSSLCAAAAVGVFYSCGTRFLRDSTLALPLHIRSALAALFAAILALSWALWSNATRAEVYALQALLLALSLRFILDYENTKRSQPLLLASFCLALALTNHHVMALMFFVPALALVLIPTSRPHIPLALKTAVLGGVGLCALLYLPLRSLAHPLVNFGAPHTLERFFWTLRGAAFSKSVGGDFVSSPLVDGVQIIVMLASTLTLPLFLLALWGGVKGLNTPSTRMISLFLSAVLLLSSTVRIILGFDPLTSDHHAYLLPAIMALSLFSMLGAAHLCSLALTAKRPLSTAPTIVVIAIALVIPLQLWSRWQQSNRAGAWVSDDVAHWELSSLPPRSLVLTAYFQTTFRQWATVVIEGARPDLTLIDRSFLSYPGMAEEAIFHHPDMQPLIDAPLRPGTPSPISRLQTLASIRPLFVQQHPSVDTALQHEILPAGPFARFSAPNTDQATQRDQDARAHLQDILSRAVPASLHEALGTILWHDATRLHSLCTLGMSQEAALVFADAIALAPQDEMLLDMAVRCQLRLPK